VTVSVPLEKKTKAASFTETDTNTYKETSQIATSYQRNKKREVATLTSPTNTVENKKR